MSCFNRTILAFVVAGVAAAATNLLGGENDAPNTANAGDLLAKTEIIGVLGKPLGTLTTIRGTWRRVNWKDAEAVFLVSHLDGNSTSRRAEFKNSSVRAIWNHGDSATAHDVQWDWKARFDGNRKSPDTAKVTEGEEWEMIGAEDGRVVVGLSEQFWNELGGAWLQAPPRGYHPGYSFIAVRRLQGKK